MNGNKDIKTFYILTFGCQMNLADSSTLASILLTRGYRRVEDPSEAGLIVVNTCSVREKAEKRAIGRINDLASFKQQNKRVKIAVIGCMAQRMADDLLALAPHVDFIMGTDRLFELPDILEGKETTSSKVMTAFGHENIDLIEPVKETPYSAFVTISRGCNNFCSYCIVPYVRGREVAHSAEHIVDSVQKLAEDGVVEVTLLGQNVNSYTHEGMDFPDLLQRVARSTDIQRIRYMTSHPKDLSRKLVDVMAEEKKVMPHIHLPLQAGSNRILKKMGRKYTIEHYLDIVDYIRSKLAYVCLTTDLIVGFPSETEDEYNETLQVVKTVEYDSAFMFRYSVRPGTKAADMVDDVPEDDKIRRLEKLIKIQQEIAHKRNQREIDRLCYGLVEGVSRRSRELLRARVESNKTVIFKGNGNSPRGEIVPLKIISADAFTLHGELAREV